MTGFPKDPNEVAGNMDPNSQSNYGNIPSGFVNAEVLGKSGWVIVGEGPEAIPNTTGLERIPCVLYTDGSGANLFEIEVGGQKYYLPVGTD